MRAKDHDEIVRVVHLYVDGFNDNDVGKFKEAFHDDAWIFYIDADGRLTKNPICENFAHWAAPPSWNVVGRIVSVTQVGDVASVQIVWDRTSNSVGRMDRLPQSDQDRWDMEDHQQDRCA